MFSLVPQAFAAPLATNCDPGSDSLNLTNCLKLNGTQAVGDVYTTPTFLINLIVRNLFVIAGIVIFIMIIVAGWKYLTDGSKGPDEAKGILTAAVGGLLLMFAAYWIIQIIKVVTGANLGI